MRRILLVIALGSLTGNMVGCGDSEKKPTVVAPDAPKPPGDAPDGKP